MSVVLITGATSGIGQLTAEMLAAKSWKVVISGRRKEEGDKIVTKIREAGGEATFIEADMRNEESVKALIQETIKTYGQLDAAVNNAGISTDTALFHELKTELFQDMLLVNVMGVFWCMKYQLEHMSKFNKGKIVNLASIAGLHGVPFVGSYAATKHAVVGMTKTAALDYAERGITVNAVAPGAMKTSILGSAIETGLYSEESIASMFPVKRLGDPRAVANAVDFLLNNDFATGSVLSVDGGYGV